MAGNSNVWNIDISDVWNGRAGLAKTYWLWGVLGNIPWAIALQFVTPGTELAIVTVLGFVAYVVMVNVGIWRAASQYQGLKLWAILAKIAVAILPATLIVVLIVAIGIPVMTALTS